MSQIIYVKSNKNGPIEVVEIVNNIAKTYKVNLHKKTKTLIWAHNKNEVKKFYISDAKFSYWIDSSYPYINQTEKNIIVDTKRMPIDLELWGKLECDDSMLSI